MFSIRAEQAQLEMIIGQSLVRRKILNFVNNVYLTRHSTFYELCYFTDVGREAMKHIMYSLSFGYLHRCTYRINLLYFQRNDGFWPVSLCK